MKSFTVIYDSNGGIGKAMEPTIVEWGKPTQIRENTFHRDGYQFVGWKAYRFRDKKMCYMNKEDKKRRFYSINDQPEGWVPQIYSDQCRVAKLSPVDHDIVIFYAQWKEIIDFRQRTSDDNKAFIENRLLTRSVVLYGRDDECKDFYNRYKEKLKIRAILLDDVSKISFGEQTVEIKTFSPIEFFEEDYIVICCPVKIRGDDNYKKYKKNLVDASLVISEDFVRSDVAEAILEKKKLWLWFGFCQADTLRNEIFQKIESVRSKYVLAAFRYGLDTLSNSYKFDDCTELLKICDCLSYIPVIFAKGKLDFNFEDYLPLNTKKMSLPRLPFRGYYPYRETDMEEFHHFSVDGKFHWPFGYSEKIIDDLILSGKSDDEIYFELMQEDLIPENEIQKNLKLAYKFIQISESTTDIKMLDYIKDNIQIRRLYRDGLHYQNCMYFEMARRVSSFMDLGCEEEIDILEKDIEKKGTQFIDYTEVPILPCVAKALKLDFITDDTLYRVRFTEKGAWRGTKSFMKEMTRKEWIYSYVRYTRACITLCEFWPRNK